MSRKKKSALDGVPANLPKGTPLVVNGASYYYFKCKVKTLSHDPESRCYLVEVAEDYVDPTGWLIKKGEKTYMPCHCLYGKDDIPNEWGDDLKQHVMGDVPASKGEPRITHRDLVNEALDLLVHKLSTSKGSSDRRKLDLLLSERKRILSNCEDSV